MEKNDWKMEIFTVCRSAKYAISPYTDGKERSENGDFYRKTAVIPGMVPSAEQYSKLRITGKNEKTGIYAKI